MSCSPQKRQQPSSVSFTQQHYQGVIPPPEMMEGFASIDPSFPDRILKMAEKEGDARRERERYVLSRSFAQDICGLISGIIVVGGVIWLCAYLANKGFGNEAAWVAGSVMVGLAIVFVLRKSPKIGNSTTNKESRT